MRGLCVADWNVAPATQSENFLKPDEETAWMKHADYACLLSVANEVGQIKKFTRLIPIRFG
ncbi:hypothetical protein GCM10028806_26060 [Spirosoma terrae]